MLLENQQGETCISQSLTEALWSLCLVVQSSNSKKLYCQQALRKQNTEQYGESLIGPTNGIRGCFLPAFQLC